MSENARFASLEIVHASLVPVDSMTEEKEHVERRTDGYKWTIIPFDAFLNICIYATDENITMP